MGHELWARLAGLLEKSSSVNTSSFKEIETLHRNLYCIFECLASTSARVIYETRMRALPLGKRQECFKTLRWT